MESSSKCSSEPDGPPRKIVMVLAFFIPSHVFNEVTQ